MLAIYAEITHRGLEPVTAELVTAVKALGTNDEIVLLAAGDKAESYLSELSLKGVDKIYLTELKGSSCVQSDLLAHAMAAKLEQLKPDAVLLPATKTAREVFSRVAMELGLGMTADCTGLAAEQTEGRTVVHQIKPSFGSQVLVSCDVPQGIQVITVRTGSYEPAPVGGKPEVVTDEYTGESAIEVLDFEASEAAASITGADIIVAGGKGAIESGALEKLKAYAEKIGAAVAGSRPLADNGHLPFEAQIGQSGTVVRPQVIITMGVSGAVQFTEGIKGDPLVIAVNTDPEAAIFSFADYAVVEDMNVLLDELLK